VAAIAADCGLIAVQRSQGALPNATTEIYVYDTLGELGLIYRLASVVFMGGSLVPHGGQNPIEPIKLGAAVVHGPHVANFADLYRALDEASGTDAVTDPHSLAARLAGLLGNPPARTRLAMAGRRTIETLAGAVDRSMAAIEPYLLQIRLASWTRDA
jgi:3-deoxy-D-manno-octulosonic-acid transferase